MVRGPYYEFCRLLPWNIESAMSALVFYCTGNVLTKHYTLQEIQECIEKRKVLSIIAIIVVTTILVFLSHWNGHVSIGSNLLGKSTWVYYLTAYMGILSIVLFSVLVCSIKTENRIINACIGFGRWFGQKSFWVMAMHVPILRLFIFGFAAFLKTDIRYVRNDYFWFAVIFILTCAICCGLSLIIEKIKKKDEQWIEKWMGKKVNA